MCTSAILLTKQDMNMGEMIKMICREKKTNLSYCRNSVDLILTMINANPEVVIHDEESIPFDISLYRDAKNSQKLKMPIYVLVTFCPEKFENLDENISVVDKKDYANEVRNIIDKAEEKTYNALTENRKVELRSKISCFLNKLGLNAKYLGFGYIKDLVIDVIEDKRKLQSFNTKLYPLVAIKYNTQVINIERNVRNAINIAIIACKDKEVYNELVGVFKLRENSKAPSNKQFISWLAEKFTF